jgi:hypothetical protein
MFQNRYLKQSKLFQDKWKINKVKNKYDVIVSGSDQIWAPNVFNPVYMGDFKKSKNQKKISYAASIGLSDIPESLIDTYKELLSDFDHVSVREETGKELLLNSCDCKSKVVLDPTLLLNTTQYDKLLKKVQNIKQPYVFCYFLNKNHKYRAFGISGNKRRLVL